MASSLRKKSGNKAGAGCLILFSLPFAAVGVVMGYFVFSTLLAWQQAQGWEEVSARIIKTNLESHTRVCRMGLAPCCLVMKMG